jgi:hypothetical protein
MESATFATNWTDPGTLVGQAPAPTFSEMAGLMQIVEEELEPMNKELPKDEAERRAQAVAGRMLNTPPQPRTKPVNAAPESPGYKLGRQQPGPAKAPGRARVAKSGKRGQADGAS